MFCVEKKAESRKQLGSGQDKQSPSPVPLAVDDAVVLEVEQHS